MDNTKLTMEIDYPVLATKGVALFPHNDINIEAGRVFSKRAIRKANEAFNGTILVVPQLDPTIDNHRLVVPFRPMHRKAHFALTVVTRYLLLLRSFNRQR